MAETDKITVPTYEQISIMLSKLATNYSNIAILFYDIFYNTTPMDVTLQMYDEAGVLQTYTIPNRAKDRANVLSGEGSPEGRVEGDKGVIYQDLQNGDLYIKIIAGGSAGWTKFVTSSEMQDILIEGIGSPEEVVVADRGTLYVDKPGATLYIKGTTEGSTGWVMISANTESLADRDLSNLSAEGERHFAKPDFSNISSVAQAMFDVKENVANKITSVSASSNNTRYPTAKAVYTFVTNSIANFADRDLSNVTTEAEIKFLGNNKLGNGVLEATTPIYREGEGNIIVLPINTKLLCTNGLNANGTYKNEVISIEGDPINGTIPNVASKNGFIFYDYTTNLLRTPEEANYFYGTTTPALTMGAVWFNPVENVYYTVQEVGGSNVWAPSVIAEIGKWTTTSAGILDKLEPYRPMRLIDTESRELDHSVIEVGGTEENWYRLYKDGWLEMGGYLTGGGTVNLLKEFKSTHYTLVPSANATGFTKTTSSFTITAGSSSKETDWMAKGWAK